jgi:hypothetical protein
VAPLQMSMHQKSALLRPVMASATECIAHQVESDARFVDSMQAGDIRELIVDSMAPCLAPVRALIDTYDRLFGEGEGASFFMGPFLDMLPTALMRQFESAAK